MARSKQSSVEGRVPFMDLPSWIWNLLDYPRRRKAVRTLASARDRIAQGRKTFHQICEKRISLLDQLAALEKEGFPPKPRIDCLKSVESLRSLAAQNLQQFTTPICKFRTNFHGTKENEVFVKRCLDCVPKLQRRVDWLVAEVGRWASQLKPDNLQLGRDIVRLQQIDTYFTFPELAVKPNGHFKHKMAPDGRFYNIREDLSSFPCVAASLLKYKKHEWFVVGLEKERQITLLWLNKGENGTRVCLALPFERLADIAQANEYSSLLIFHNHPNPDPGRYTCTRPSQVDLDGSALRAKELNDLGINLLEFICERGRPYLYRFYIANTFLLSSASVEALRGKLNL